MRKKCVKQQRCNETGDFSLTIFCKDNEPDEGLVLDSLPIIHKKKKENEREKEIIT